MENQPFGIANDGFEYNAESLAVAEYLKVSGATLEASIGSVLSIHNLILAQHHVSLSSEYKKVEEIIVDNISSKIESEHAPAEEV